MNIEEIDKWLDNEYGSSYTRLEELHDYFFEKYTDQQEEIKRLNKRMEDLNTINEEHQILNGMIRKELQQKENIIKEAREYIEERYNGEVLTHTFDKDNVGELLEILDKGSEMKNDKRSNN